MDPRDKLVNLSKRRERLQQDLDRYRGRLEEAQNNLRKAEQECRDRKIDPERVDEVITKLEKHYSGLVDEMETSLVQAETKLQQFTGV